MDVTGRPLTLMISALGGQGGGVVADWLVDVARRERHLVQATSVPGVAQRTGATFYYLEFFPESDLPADGRRPVMALMPTPGDVDIVVAAEALEAARAVERGFVTPDRTALIASTHRVYTIGEKSALDDGRADAARLAAETARAALRYLAFDMATIADRSGAIISAVLLGAIAGAGVLPFRDDSYRAAIRATGRSVDANLVAFEGGRAASATAVEGGFAAEHPPAAPGSGDRLVAALEAADPDATLAPVLLARIDDFPDALRALLSVAALRLVDYQDVAHATQYLDRVAAVLDCEADRAGSLRLTREVAHRLAIWMSFEDTIRVADLKTRADRLARIRAQLRVRDGQLVEITEFMKPRVEEICGTLPARLGGRLLASPAWRRRLARMTGDREIRTTSIGGFALLRSVAALRRWRRGTLRYAEEDRRIVDWLARVARLAGRDYDLAVEVAASQRLVRGYGDTHARGFRSFARLLDVAERLAGRPGAAGTMQRLRAAALADELGSALDHALAQLDRAAVPGEIGSEPFSSSGKNSSEPILGGAA
jgi:indolepyruvate ferredoxin oxidoreductase beta subunit